MNLIKDSFKRNAENIYSQLYFNPYLFYVPLFEITTVLYLIKNEISLFHNNSALLNRLFGGYTEYLDHLTKSNEPIDNTILADKEELNEGTRFLMCYSSYIYYSTFGIEKTRR